MSIQKKILEIQQEIEVKKTGIHPKYDQPYFKDSDVVDAVRDEMNKRGIIAIPKVVQWKASTFYDTNGRYRPTVFATVAYRFIDPEDGSEEVIEVAAEGSAVGDDASSRKLFTQARKIAFLQLFQIGEDNKRYDSDENDVHEPVNMTEPVAPGSDLNELTDTVRELINDDGPIDATIVKTIGDRIADELGAVLENGSWRRNVDVMSGLVAALKRGEVE